MRKWTFVLGLLIMASWTAYGQDVIGYGTIAKGDNFLNQKLPRRNFSLKPGEFNKPNFLSEKGNTITIDRVDPFMPIAVPPNNLIKFPIKVIPEDFPSNMPVARLVDPVHPNPVLKGTGENDNYREWKVPGNLPHLSLPLRRQIPHSID